jgi:hypothetical protein
MGHQYSKRTARHPSPLAPSARTGEAAIPGPVLMKSRTAILRALCTMEPEPLLAQRQKLGLVGHLFREALMMHAHTG